MGRWLIVLSTISPLAFIGGFLLGNVVLMWVAIGILALQVVFAFVTLPVEIYSDDRVREFDSAEADLAKVLPPASVLPKRAEFHPAFSIRPSSRVRIRSQRSSRTAERIHALPEVLIGKGFICAML